MDNSFVNKLEQKTTNPSSSASKPRVEWIDLAKGVCIVLVVITHVFLVSGVSFWLDSKMTSIRMPLYFILSGLFFKSKVKSSGNTFIIESLGFQLFIVFKQV